MNTNHKKWATVTLLIILALIAIVYSGESAQASEPPEPLSFPTSAELLESGPGNWNSEDEGFYQIPPSWEITIEGWSDEVYQINDSCNFVQLLTAKSGVLYRTVFWKTEGLNQDQVDHWISEGWHLESGPAWNLCAEHQYLAWTNIEPWIVSEVGGGVFEDSDGDALWEQGESGIADVTVRLTDCDAQVFQEVTTSEWNYRFYNVEPGSYCVTANESTLPEGNWQLTTASNPLTVTVSSGDVIDDLHFGYQQAEPTATATSTAQPTPRPTATSTPTATPEPTATATSTATATATATATLTPTIVPTPTLTPTVEPGEHLVFLPIIRKDETTEPDTCPQKVRVSYLNHSEVVDFEPWPGQMRTLGLFAAGTEVRFEMVDGEATQSNLSWPSWYAVQGPGPTWSFTPTTTVAPPHPALGVPYEFHIWNSTPGEPYCLASFQLQWDP